MLQLKTAFSKHRLMWLAVLLLWVKTYFIYKFGFLLASENFLQELLLVINPISSALLLMAISFFFDDKRKHAVIVIISFIASFILYANLVYHRFFTDFLTLPVLFQTSNMNDLKSSVFELLSVFDIVWFSDVILLAWLAWKKKAPQPQTSRAHPRIVLMLAIIMLVTNLTIAHIERPQLLTRAFDREMLVKYIGTFHYHLYDLYVQSKSKAQRVLAKSTDIIEIKNYTKTKYEKPDEELFGIAQGKNVYIISLESLQDFVLHETIDGEEITPFLNRLIKDSYFFENFYHQTAQGKTSDAEFIIDNSLFGRESGAVFFTNATNKYNALPKILKEHGYFTAVMHANNKSFWNRDIMYEALGYDKFFDVTYYDVNEENSVGWGLKDKDFFEQSMDLIKSLPEPHYVKFITLTNHFPFELGEEDKSINEFNSNSQTLNRYVTTARYLDESIEYFFQLLKEEGLYENSIIILYGDHYGISELHRRAMAQFLQKEEITPFDHVQLQRVPLFIHIPGHDGHKIESKVAGQIDLKPTIMHLLGITDKNDIQFGTDLFAPKRAPFVVLRNGTFITEQYVFTDGVCYDKNNGEETEFSYCEPYIERAKTDLEYSDKIINGDLLRFNEENKSVNRYE